MLSPPIKKVEGTYFPVHPVINAHGLQVNCPKPLIGDVVQDI